jgi:hypothetical protein
VSPASIRQKAYSAAIARTLTLLGFAAILFLMAPMRARAASGNSEATPADTLERMARAAFGDLSTAELRLVRTAPTRDVAWASPAQNPDEPVNDLAKADTWGKERTIRAKIIAWLLSDAQASKLVHPSGIGVAAARIAGKLDLSYLTISAPLTLIACSIPDGVDISYGQLSSIDLRRSWTGPIVGDQSIIHGDVTMRSGHYDDVSFFRSEIDGNLDCSSGHFIGDNPLMAVDATIKGDALFHEGFETSGVVDFRLAKVEQSLSFNNARFTGKGDNGLNAERALVSGAIYWVDIITTPRTQLDLNNAHAGSLWDDQKSWPAPGNLFIDGFVYSDFSGGPTDGIRRLEWLRLQPASLQAQPQPYRQLAQVLRENGSQEGAIRAEIARENALAEYGGISLGNRVWRFALRITIGYGYRPLRALWWILLFVLLGTALFRWGYRARLITPTEEVAYEAFIKSGTPPKHYPPFNSFVYSLENFLPVVDLHQGAYWRPNPHHIPAAGRARLRWGDETAPAKMLQWYLWLHILAGWTITPLLFAGLAGLLRND